MSCDVNETVVVECDKSCNLIGVYVLLFLNILLTLGLFWYNDSCKCVCCPAKECQHVKVEVCGKVEGSIPVVVSCCKESTNGVCPCPEPKVEAKGTVKPAPIVPSKQVQVSTCK